MSLLDDGSISDKSAENGHDHRTLKEGDYDPELNKVVNVLVMCDDKFIVYLAEDYSIQWRTTDDHKPPEYCGVILNRVASLEMRSRFIADKEILRGIRYQIAEGLSRCFEEQSPRSLPSAILDEVATELEARNRETSWGWYFSSAYRVTGICVAMLVAVWLCRVWMRAAIGFGAFEVLLGTLCGAVGALLSVTTRGNRLVMDANAGQSIHNLEGLSRIGAGIGGAFLVSLCMKGGVLLAGASFSGSRLALQLAFCIAAGASERLVPSLLKSMDTAAAPVDRRTGSES
jgi:hypothetical protein